MFDENITSRVILIMVSEKFVMLIRGMLKLFLNFRMPQLVFIGPRVRFFNAHNIKFGKWVKIDNDVLLGALGNGRLSIGNSSGIGAFSRVEISQSFNNVGSHIYIGDNVGVGPYASLGGAGGLEIGSECIIGPYFSCHPENHNFLDLDVSIRNQGVTRKGIKIGENCWIGAKVSILDGVEIGAGCVIAAGAVVNKSFPSNSIIGGVPARLIKTRSDSKIKLAS